MGQPLEEPSPPPALPEDLAETIRRLDDERLLALSEYAGQLAERRRRPIAELIAETQDVDRIEAIESEDGHARVTRRDGDDGRPYVYRVTREQLPNGDVQLNWHLLGMADE